MHMNRELTKKELEDKVAQLYNELYKITLTEHRATQVVPRFLDKIYNPLHPPENVIPEGGFYNKGYDAYQDYQQLGFITNENGQFPVFGRYKYPGRTDRYEYYTINEGRNRIKIPFHVRNYEELYSDDPVVVPELSGSDFTFTKYENEGVRYNPNLI